MLLAVLLCAGIFAACGGDGETTSNTSAAASAPTTDDNEYGEFPYADKNFEGSDPIRLLCVETARHKYGEQQFSYIEENGASAINSAVQNRNNFLEEQYGISFELYPVKYPNETLKLAVETGTDDYDMINESVDRLVAGINQGYYWSLSDKMDLSHPWWDQEAIKNLSLGDKYFIICGDAIITDDDNTYLTLYNKKIYSTNADLQAYGNIYDLVREGKWTVDLYYEMCRLVSRADENGNWGFDATYGNLSHAYGTTVMMNGCGIATVSKNEANELVVNVMNQQSVNAYNKVYELMADPYNTQRAEVIIGSGENPSQYGFAELAEMFNKGRGLFYNTTATNISILKSADLDFEIGVLPIPKFDEAQEKYYNTVNMYHSTALAIPASVTADRLDRLTFAMQALGYYNRDVIDAYYSQTLQLQALQTDDDAAMLDLIYNNRFYDIGAIYNWGGLGSIYGDIVMAQKGNTLSSVFDSKSRAINLAIARAVKDYEKMLADSGT